MLRIYGWASPMPSLPGGRKTVRALIEAGILEVGDLLVCGQHLAAVLPDGRVRLDVRAHQPFASLSAAAERVLGYPVNGWPAWRCLRDGELLADKRVRWMRGAAAA